jgi:hypothetical protein
LESFIEGGQSQQGAWQEREQKVQKALGMLLLHLRHKYESVRELLQKMKREYSQESALIYYHQVGKSQQI